MDVKTKVKVVELILFGFSISMISLFKCIKISMRGEYFKWKFCKGLNECTLKIITS